ncbi:hypothetical protein [Brumicola blandensis]|uniref:Uncharacterized protein n=1 Tax=Brumicola blandensis TaxID=3075611 RepID=A0AAW8R3J5_9ALTE|nr:hypothetical protein [Alteromonas sp. W409]MDT0581713.1 hypothetical protein [Alteromonas sp. W409]
MNSMEGIDLQDSFVLDWSESNSELVFQIEASVWPGSKHYVEPKESEHTCYKKASIRFFDFDSISGLKSKSEVVQSSDASGELDYGNIDSFSATSRGFLLDGDFGNVLVTGGKVVFTVHT